MAKYQAYAEYKDSGTEWLGKIPESWEKTYVKYMLKAAPCYGILKPDKYSGENSVPVIRILDIDKNIVDTTQLEAVSPHLSAEYNRTILTEGDLVISVVGTIGKTFICDKNLVGMNLSRALARVQVKNVLYARYLQFLIESNSFHDYINVTCNGAAQKVFNMEALSNWAIPSPNMHEMKCIIEFLEYETAKIDHLIEKQQQLIELLKEKRQAVISHAVTKGLDPNVLMKDSGVEWLGEVPEHWQLVPLKYLCTFSGGGTPTKDNLSYWTDGNIPWVSPKDMKTFWISETQDYITEKAVKESSTNTVEQNSLLMVVRSGILQRTIPIAINTVPVTMNQDMKALKFGKRVLVEYIANLIHGNTVQLLLEWSKEGATVESIEHEYLANSLIPVPSLKEQEEITQVIAKKMKVYAELTEKAELQITLLQERRTALISAAVTGKIDVRNWQAPTVAEAHPELSA